MERVLRRVAGRRSEPAVLPGKLGAGGELRALEAGGVEVFGASGADEDDPAPRRRAEEQRSTKADRPDPLVQTNLPHELSFERGVDLGVRHGRRPYREN
jgi:hypothetical protein